jgi:protein gp37
MSALTRYHASERALVEAKTIDRMTEVCGMYDGIRKLARTMSDRAAEIEAAEFSIRAKRKLGEMIIAAAKAGALAKPPGGSKKRPRKDRVKNNPTLESAGVDKNLAHEARKLGRLEPREFKERLATWHGQVNGGGAAKITTTLPAPRKEPASPKIRSNNISLKEWEKLSEPERLELLQLHNFPSDVQFTKQDSTGIEWAQQSWNPVVGCRHDCPYCYARDMAEQRYPDMYPHKFEPAIRPYMFHAPRNTNVPAEAATDVRFKNVFTCSMADLFGRWVPAEWIELTLRTVRDNPQWNFLFLTKFPKRMAEFDIPPNAWMGTTVDLQARVASAEAAFAKIKTGIRWLSVEPMLEPLKFERLDLFNWVVIGGASKSSKTPSFKPPLRWIVDLWDQAEAAGCAVYMKTNLLGNRVLELPFDAPIKGDATKAPSVFNYLKKGES